MDKQELLESENDLLREMINERDNAALRAVKWAVLVCVPIIVVCAVMAVTKYHEQCL